MPSNVENILNGILTGDGSGIQKPASRVEELLFEIYEQGGGGGDSVIGGIKLTIDSNYVMTAALVGKDGEEYGVTDNIDLPLEEMVVDGEYDPQTKNVKLELKNGSYVEFSVADLVSGLQTELSSGNKLNPAYIAYDASHRAVSDTEKSTWNGKQNAISDLEDIRSGAAAGATAVQPATMTEALAAKQNSLSEAQLAAVNSGIDNTKVEQIETNKTNILYTLGKTGKNLFKLDMNTVRSYNTGGTWNGNTYTLNGLTITFNDDGTISLTGKATARTTIVLDSYVPSHIRFRSLNGLILSGCPKGGAWNSYSLKLEMTTSPYSSAGQDTGNSSVINTSAIPSSATLVGFTLDIFTNYPSSAMTFKPMFCTPEDWAVGHDYAPYALPNSDLTILESEDRAALAEVVNSGAKNKFNPANIAELRNLTTNGSDYAYVSTDTDTRTQCNFCVFSWNGSTKIDQLTKVDTTANGKIALTFTKTASYNKISFGHSGQAKDFMIFYNVSDLVNGQTYVLSVNITQFNPSVTNFAFSDVMICTRADWKVSQKFVPFGNNPFYQVPINHNMVYRGQNLGATLTDAQHTALSSGNFTDLYLGDYWTKSVAIPAGTYKDGGDAEVTVPAQTVTLKAVIADFDTFYAGYASSYAGINTHHAAVIVTGFNNVVWNSTNTTAGGYVNSLIHKWLVGSVLPQIETWFGSAKVLSHQKLLTNAITGDAASGWVWSSQKISLLSENQMYGSKVWGNSKAANGAYEPGEAFKHLNVFNHIDANLLFGNRNIWLRDIASAVGAARLIYTGNAGDHDASNTWIAPAALILLS